MGVGIVMFIHISHHISPCAIGLKSPLGTLNMADQYSITWDYINIILNITIGELDQLVLNLEGANKIPKEVSEFIGCDDTKLNA